MSPLNFGLVSGTQFNLGLETLPFAFSVTNQSANQLCLAGIELIAAFYGCLYSGCIPVTVRPPHAQNLTATLPTVRMIVDVSTWYNFPCPHLIKPQVRQLRILTLFQFSWVRKSNLTPERYLLFLHLITVTSIFSEEIWKSCFWWNTGLCFYHKH